jgi:hypothetical protein
MTKNATVNYGCTSLLSSRMAELDEQAQEAASSFQRAGAMVQISSSSTFPCREECSSPRPVSPKADVTNILAILEDALSLLDDD